MPMIWVKTKRVGLKNPLSPDNLMDSSYESTVLVGSVSLTNDESPDYPIKILRDTGASQSLILTQTLPFSESFYSGKML